MYSVYYCCVCVCILTCFMKVKLKGWKMGTMACVGGVERRNSQVGQLLYYLVAVQLKKNCISFQVSNTQNYYEQPTVITALD